MTTPLESEMLSIWSGQVRFSNEVAEHQQHLQCRRCLVKAGEPSSQSRVIIGSPK